MTGGDVAGETLWAWRRGRAPWARGGGGGEPWEERGAGGGGGGEPGEDGGRRVMGKWVGGVGEGRKGSLGVDSEEPRQGKATQPFGGQSKWTLLAATLFLFPAPYSRPGWRFASPGSAALPSPLRQQVVRPRATQRTSRCLRPPAGTSGEDSRRLGPPLAPPLRPPSAFPFLAWPPSVALPAGVPDRACVRRCR